MNFTKRIHVETVTHGSLRCEAALRDGRPCGKELRFALKREPERVEDGGGIVVAMDVRAIRHDIESEALRRDWSMIEDDKGLYVVCSACHRRERYVPLAQRSA